MTIKERAAWWYRRVNKKYPNEIADSIKRSKIYGPAEPVGTTAPFLGVQTIHARNTDSVSCLTNIEPNGKRVCILNYASYWNPGGMFLNGARSQEESLCHESTLYPVLEAHLNDYYIPNRHKENSNHALYTNRAIYSPDIIFERGGEIFKCDVLTCAAPNWDAASKNRVDYEKNLRALKDRVNFMYKVCKAENVDILIAGAWGCGVFRQDPKEMCDALVNDKDRIEEVYFAIPDEHNYREFIQVLEEKDG